MILAEIVRIHALTPSSMSALDHMQIEKVSTPTLHITTCSPSILHRDISPLISPITVHSKHVSLDPDSISETRRPYIESQFAASFTTISSVASQYSVDEDGPFTDEMYSQLNRYGFLVEKDGAERRENAAEHRSAQGVNIENHRILKWLQMSEKVPDQPGKLGSMHFRWDINSKRFVKRVFKGVPDIWRGEVWRFLLAKWSPESKAGLNMQLEDLSVRYQVLLIANSRT